MPRNADSWSFNKTKAKKVSKVKQHEYSTWHVNGRISLGFLQKSSRRNSALISLLFVSAGACIQHDFETFKGWETLVRFVERSRSGRIILNGIALFLLFVFSFKKTPSYFVFIDLQRRKSVSEEFRNETKNTALV